MSASVSHLLPASVEALQLPLKERIDYCFNEKWIAYPQAAEVLSELEHAFERQRSTRPTNFALIAPSNNGKSTILKRFAKLHPVKLVDAQQAVMAPCVLHLVMPSTPTESSLCSIILKALNIHHSERDPPMKKYAQVLRVLAYAEVRVLMFDEFNHIANAGRKAGQVLAMLKNLCTEGQVTVVASGIETVRNALQSEDQIKNRFVILELKHWTMNPSYKKVVEAYERFLPLAEPSGLASSELLPLIYGMAGDTIGGTVRLLQEAAAHALRTQKECIDAQMLRSMPFRRYGT